MSGRKTQIVIAQSLITYHDLVSLGVIAPRSILTHQAVIVVSIALCCGPGTFVCASLTEL